MYSHLRICINIPSSSREVFLYSLKWSRKSSTKVDVTYER